MKKSFKQFCKVFAGIKFMLLAFAIANSATLSAQEKQSVTGKLIEGKSNQPVSLATVALVTPGAGIAGGTMSDENGIFRISPVIPGNYILKVTNIGFKPETRNIEVLSNGVTDLGIILLQDTSIMLHELVIVGERIKAKKESDRTTFNVTQKMLDVSHTGTDILKLIPGVQIDLMRNISLEGSTAILIFVDGKERDKNFISQLNPGQIDRIEVISAPPSDFDGNVTGAINIVLKKDSDSGISGHILAEIPVSSSLVYVFPSYSLNWSYKKLNLYTSYDGEMTYLNLNESTSRKALYGKDSNEIILTQDLMQKEWSHRFHFGFDYYLTDRDQFNFYGYYNPSSRELDGTGYFRISGLVNEQVNSVKEDTDLNTGTFFSFYYKHNFAKKGSELTADISNYFLSGENLTNYLLCGSDNDTITWQNAINPEQNAFSLRIDFKTPFLEKFIFSTGVKTKLQSSNDRFNQFEYDENIFAIYGNLAYKKEKVDLSIGLRTEKSFSELKNTFSNPLLSFLPNATIRYKLNSKQNLQLSYNRLIRRPNLYQLNPAALRNDPYSLTRGNPFLKPSLSGSIFLEHSIQFDGNYLSSQLFYNRTTAAINDLLFINDTNVFETSVHNLGTINQLGLQISGTLKISLLTLNPYFKISGLQTSGNDIAKYYSIANKNIIGFESGLSAIASFKHDIACSLTLQYNSPKNYIQGSSYSDLLCFLSVEKTFKQKIRVGIVSAMPFTRSFTYNGTKTDGRDFQSSYEGNVIMPAVPVWFKLGFQFNSGKNRIKINREKEEIETLPKKGF
jgi:outer membrane receptor protein involved in Fe transport